MKGELLYSREHVWIQPLGGNRIKIGITDYAQGKLGEIIQVEFMPKGEFVKASRPLGTLESVKTVSDIYAPLDGKIIEANDMLMTQPEIVNKDPYQSGWVAKLEWSNENQLKNLLSAEEYSILIEGE